MDSTSSSKKSYAILMAGQLSEAEGMGLPLARNRLFPEVADEFDALTGGRFGAWITSEPQADLSERNTAPIAVVLFDTLCGRLALSRWGNPSIMAGYSLGFYAGAASAGAFPPALALEWIGRVNALMDRHFPRGLMGLAVCVGLDRAELESEFRDRGFGGLRVANVNNQRQIVFSGPSQEVAAALEELSGRVLSARLLPLDTPLHTDYMVPLARELEPWWRQVPVEDPAVPLISPVDGSVLRSGPEVRDTVLASLHHPTDWVSVVRGVRTFEPAWVLDTSGDGSLGRMTRWVDRNLAVTGYREALAGTGEPRP